MINFLAGGLFLGLGVGVIPGLTLHGASETLKHNINPKKTI